MDLSLRDGMFYLSVPYSDNETEVELKRYHRAIHVKAILIQMGIDNYCPIVEYHHVALSYELPKGVEFWSRVDMYHIKHCRGCIFYLGQGWETSVGMNAEYVFAESLKNKLIYTLTDSQIANIKEPSPWQLSKNLWGA